MTTKITIEQINVEFVRYYEEQGLDNLDVIINLPNLPLRQPTLLHIAIYNADEEMFDYLVSKITNLDLSFANGTALHLAVNRNTNLKIIKKLIDLGVPLNLRESCMHWTPLHAACYYGKLEVAELLIDSGADINITNYYNIDNPSENLGDSPMHVAIRANRLEIVELLCRKQANLNAVSMEVGSPLVYAINTGKLEIAKLLINFGADVNFESVICKMKKDPLRHIPDKIYPMTALHAAIIRSQSRMIKILLLFSTTDLNKSIDGYLTPLHSAVRFNSSMLKELLCAGASIDALTPNNKNIVEFCFEIWAQDTAVREYIKNILVEHATKLVTAGFNVVPTISISSDGDFAKACVHELESMRNNNISNGGITIDKLLGCAHSLTLTITSEEIKFMFKPDIKKNFPIYGEILQYRALRIFQRRRLLTGFRLKLVCKFFLKYVFVDLVDDDFVLGVLPFLSYNDLYRILKLLTVQAKLRNSLLMCQ